MSAFSSASRYRPISGVFFIGFTRQVMSLQAPAWEGGLEEYPFRRRNIGDGIDIAIRENDEDTLAGIFFPVRVLDIVEKPTGFNSGDNVLETYPSLGVGFE